MLQAIAAVAHGDNGSHAEAEAALAQLEQDGYHLTAAIQAIWGGQRDLAVLTTSLDDAEAALVQQVLILLELD